MIDSLSGTHARARGGLRDPPMPVEKGNAKKTSAAVAPCPQRFPTDASWATTAIIHLCVALLSPSVNVLREQNQLILRPVYRWVGYVKLPPSRFPPQSTRDRPSTCTSLKVAMPTCPDEGGAGQTAAVSIPPRHVAPGPTARRTSGERGTGPRLDFGLKALTRAGLALRRFPARSERQPGQSMVPWPDGNTASRYASSYALRWGCDKLRCPNEELHALADPDPPDPRQQGG
jgi:hypothetical protein